MTTVADVVVDELRNRGVEYIATLNGHGLDPFYLACRRAGLRMIDVRNEQAAGYMAEVTGRLTRRVGVCAVSGAVAHVNALTGVLNAWFDGAPMLLITGTCAHADMGWGNFQDFDPVPMSRSICKYARMIDVPERVGQVVHEAFVAATTGRPGPVHLTLPLDVAAAPLQTPPPRSRVQSGHVMDGGAADPALVEEVAGLIAGAERPLLIAGSGAYYARAENALRELAAALAIPIVVPIWDRGCIDKPTPQFMGVIGAATGGARILADSDLLLCVGVSFDYRLGQFQSPPIADRARIVRFDGDGGRLIQGLAADVGVAGNPGNGLRRLTAACERLGVKPFDAWFDEAAGRRAAYRRRCAAKAEAMPEGLNGYRLLELLRPRLPDDALLLVDGGNIGQWFHQTLDDRYPGTWLTCGASGVVGWGLPGAMAARAVYPDRPVVLLSGDGAVTFTIAELECAARQGLPFVVVVADDRQWGISVSGHVADFGTPLYSMLGPTRLDRVAEGFGCVGHYVESGDRLCEAFDDALTRDVPVLIQAAIAPSSPDPDLAS